MEIASEYKSQIMAFIPPSLLWEPKPDTLSKLALSV